ncbi:Uncharacterised protein [Serratia liquefaciens]|nr:Uncharacterised protein [Serratia liquefaciens]
MVPGKVNGHGGQLLKNYALKKKGGLLLIYLEAEKI